MPHIIAIEYNEAQRRQLQEKLRELNKKGWPLSGKYEANTFGTWEKLFETAITPGLFAQREVIVIENAEYFGKFPDTLAGLMEDDKADCIIILVFGTASITAKNEDKQEEEETEAKDEEQDDDKKKRKKNPVAYLKTIEKQIELIKAEKQLPPWERIGFIEGLAKTLKIDFSKDAAQMLSENIESQEELRHEITKLALYSEGRRITYADIISLSFDEGGSALMLLLDGVCDNKPGDAARGLKHLRSSPLLPVLTAITNRLRPALIMTCFKGKYSDDALKAIGANKQYAINKARSALKHFGAERIKRFMLGAVRLSYLEKTNRAEGWQGFELILWELMSKI